MANFLSRLVGGGSAVAPTSKTAPAVQSGSIAPVAGSGTEATRTDAAARMDAALHGQRERTVEGQPLFAQIVDSFPRHRIEQLQRKLGDLRPLRRAEQNWDDSTISAMPFYSHGCKVTVSYDFTNGQCQVLFNRDDLPAKTNFRFILHRDGGKYTLFLNEDGRMDSPRIESNLQGRTEVNHGACPQQYAEFMQSVAQIVAELFPVHTQAPKNAGEEGAYTDNSAHAAVERSIALGRFAQASNSREMTFGWAPNAAAKKPANEIANAIGEGTIKKMNPDTLRSRMENMSETGKAGINTCYRMLLQLRSAKSAGDVASALFDGRVTKADGSSGVRFLRDNGTTIQSLTIDISDIDTVFRELAAGQTSTLDDILARAADFYGIK